MPKSFEDGLKMSAPSTPIDIIIAEAQHQAYDTLLRELIEQVVEVPVDNAQPDSVFVEDTVIIIGSTAVTTFPGEFESNQSLCAFGAVSHCVCTTYGCQQT